MSGVELMSNQSMKNSITKSPYKKLDNNKEADNLNILQEATNFKPASTKSPNSKRLVKPKDSTFDVLDDDATDDVTHTETVSTSISVKTDRESKHFELYGREHIYKGRTKQYFFKNGVPSIVLGPHCK